MPRKGFQTWCGQLCKASSFFIGDSIMLRRSRERISRFLLIWPESILNCRALGVPQSSLASVRYSPVGETNRREAFSFAKTLKTTPHQQFVKVLPSHFLISALNLTHMAFQNNFAVDEYYHLYNRGNDKRKIFLSPRDYHRFLFLLYLNFVCHTL